MLKRQHIEYELGKLKTKIYNIEQEIFKTFTEIQEDINELNKFIRSTYGLRDNEDKISQETLQNLDYFKQFENIENTPVMKYKTIFDKPIDLTKAKAKKGRKK